MALFLSAITIGEINKGIERLPAESSRKQALALWLNNDLIRRFSDRIYPITTEVMLYWGSLFARLEASGQLISTMDSLIAATALVNHVVLVTRNEDHFRSTGVEIINPSALYELNKYFLHEVQVLSIEILPGRAPRAASLEATTPLRSKKVPSPVDVEKSRTSSVVNCASRSWPTR